FGGAPEKVEGKLDDGIYILDTASRTWSKHVANGNPPNGLIGHTATIIGSVIYMFGGQKFGSYSNDFVSLDLKALKLQKKKGKFGKFSLGRNRENSAGLCWNVVDAINEGPPARRTRTWTNLSCIGYFPVPRERHSAVIVDEVIYIFGGITQEGEELDDLVAFRITNQRWYRFPQMGPSPSARYGLSMSVVDEKIFIFGGDSKKLPKPDSEGDIHVLDTSKIKFPPGTLPGMPMLTRRDSYSQRRSMDSSRSENESSTVPKILVVAPQESEDSSEQPTTSHAQPTPEFRVKTKPNLVIVVPPIGDFNKHMPTDQNLHRDPPIDSDQDDEGKNMVEQDVENQSPSFELQDVEVSTGNHQDLSFVNESNMPTSGLQINDPVVIPYPPEVESVSADFSELEIMPRDRKTRLDTINEDVEEDSEQCNTEYDSDSVYDNSEENSEHENSEDDMGVRVEDLNMQSNSVEVDHVDVPVQDNNSEEIDEEPNSDHRSSPLQLHRGTNRPPENKTHITAHIANSPALDRSDVSKAKHLSLPNSLDNYSLSKKGEHDYDISSLMNRLTMQSPMVPAVSTPDKESFMSFPESTRGSPELNVESSGVEEKDDRVPELEQEPDIEEYKRREIWYNAELDFARKLGYLTDLNYSDDVDFEVMKTNFGEPGSEKYRVMQSIIKMKQELAKAKEIIESQAQTASERVTLAEKEKTAALEEAALYKIKLEELKPSEPEINSQESGRVAKLESQLAQVLKENKLLSNQLLKYYKKTERERVKAQSYHERENSENVRTEMSNRSREHVFPELEKLRTRVVNSEAQLKESNHQLAKMDSELKMHKEESRVQISQLTESLEKYYIIFNQINNSINVTNERSDRLEKILRKLRNEKNKYEAEIAELKVELNTKHKEVVQVEDKLKDMEKLLENVQDEGRILRLMMQEGIKELLNINLECGKGGENVWQAIKLRQLEEELEQLKSQQDENDI
ncbi:2112_t:CDS:2, partial [Acaulospora colombiana]